MIHTAKLFIHNIAARCKAGLIDVRWCFDLWFDAFDGKSFPRQVASKSLAELADYRMILIDQPGDVPGRDGNHEQESVGMEARHARMDEK